MAKAIDEAIRKTDWALLAKQKEVLFKLASDDDRYDEEVEALNGILNWIDEIQDAAEVDGLPVVFLTADEVE